MKLTTLIRRMDVYHRLKADRKYTFFWNFSIPLNFDVNRLLIRGYKCVHHTIAHPHITKSTIIE